MKFRRSIFFTLLIIVYFFNIYNVNANLIFRGGCVFKGGVRFEGQSGAGGGAAVNAGLIGTAGGEGFGVGVCPSVDLPAGFTPMIGYDETSSDNYGNYQYSDGSVMCFIPKYYYKIGTGSNGLDVNVIDVKGIETFTNTADANAAGYALHRAFIDGGEEKSGFFIDKYECSNNGGIASSIKNGKPISTHSGHNPIDALIACNGNHLYEAINAAHGRGLVFNVSSRFMYSAISVLSMAHGDASTGSGYCQWYDTGNVTNFPKGCNNDAFGDIDDAEVSYSSDGYDNCSKTGSGTPFSKTTHNGQNCGVADLNGGISEISIGIVRPGNSASDSTQQSDFNSFYVLKESVSLKDLEAGWHLGVSGANYEAWGDADHLSVYYDVVSIAQILNNFAHKFGSGVNQVLSEDTSGVSWLYTSLGIPKDNSGNDSTGTARFGNDYLSEYYVANLAVHGGGDWKSGQRSGVWGVSFLRDRSSSLSFVGFRAACYPS